MIIANLSEGLGNQLFQYAAGRHLSLLQQTELKINIISFENYNLHQYSLHHFNIKASIASVNEVQSTRVYAEKAFNYDPNFMQVSPDVLIAGYWQSERYFSAIEDIIRDDFQITSSIEGINKDVADLINTTNSVSLHIRRGDYVHDEITYKYHGVCDLIYYEKCIDLIAQKVPDPHFFIFSDDPAWALTHINTQYKTTFVTHNNANTNFEDLRLMSLCKHNIIANSTFSWWGAWLNTNKDKIVIAPKKWFNEADLDITDLVPNKWIVI